jgi:hypothetical protein
MYENREKKEYCRKTSLEIRIRIRKMNVRGTEISVREGECFAALQTQVKYGDLA